MAKRSLIGLMRRVLRVPANCPPRVVTPCWLHGGRLPFGLDVVGYLRAEIGLGEAARLIVRAVDAAGLPTSPVDIRLPGRCSDRSLDARIGQPTRHAATLTVSSVLYLPDMAKRLCRGRTNIHYTSWELRKTPEDLRPAFDRFDAYWAPSVFVRDVLVASQKRPVHLVPQPLALPDAPPAPPDFRGPLRILTFFDYESVVARKNPQAAIEAFRLAFPVGREDARLLVKARGMSGPQARADLARLAAQDPRITVIDSTVSREEMAALMQACDVFLSLHRAEGFGLGGAEALARGKAVVTTDFGGTRDFITPETGYPVDYRTVPVPPGAYPAADGNHWAEPSVAHAAQMLRHIHDDPAAAARRALAGYRLLQRNHSFAAVGARIAELMEPLR
ncbi:glycosyltransferase [Ancylobacter aquaticus]|nr:glycosyltransferase [Ancylobacter aquaticus]